MKRIDASSLCYGLGLALASMSLQATVPTANAAGTAYGVDTAEVGDPGKCKAEAWVSAARNKDFLATANPACVVDPGTPTEVSIQFSRARSDGEWATSLAPKLKAKLVPTAIGSFGWAAAAGFSYDATSNEIGTVYAYVPGTLRLSEVVRINVMGGWQFDQTIDQHFATYGLAADWRMTDVWTLTGEVFGQLGKGETDWETRPRFQSGVRYRPVDQWSLDVIYGRNINGENANWITVGTTIRFE